MAKLRVSKKLAQQSHPRDHSSLTHETAPVSPVRLHKRTLLQESTSQDDWRGEAAPDVADAGVSSGLSAAIRSPGR